MKRIIALLSAAVLFLGILGSCAPKNEPFQEEDIRAICQLATLECYYNNVAKLEKERDNIFQKDRELWIEYEGIASIGIDMSQVSIKSSKNTVEISIPPAQLLDIYPVSETLNEKSYTYSKDGLLFKNKITTEEQQQAIQKGQEEMEQKILENQSLFAQAENQARQLIQNYVEEIGSMSGKEYEIIWKNASSSDSKKSE